MCKGCKRQPGMVMIDGKVLLCWDCYVELWQKAHPQLSENKLRRKP